MDIPALGEGGWWAENPSFLESKETPFEGQDLDVNMKDVCDPEGKYQTWPRGTVAAYLREVVSG